MALEWGVVEYLMASLTVEEGGVEGGRAMRSCWPKTLGSWVDRVWREKVVDLPLTVAEEMMRSLQSNAT